MAAADPGSLSQFLNYGGLGLLAILCIVVLGYNVWSLNGMVAKADPKRINAARPLLLAQMGVSLTGLLAVGAGGIYLDQLKSERTAEISFEPWESDPGSVLPAIEIGDRRWTGRRQPIQVPCTAGHPLQVWIGLNEFIRYRAGRSRLAQPLLPSLESAAAVER